MEEKRLTCVNQISQIAANGMTSLGMALGHRLKLFDALARVATEKDPKTAADVAREANLKERCVREWLALMACGGLIEVEENGERFWIPAESKEFLAGPNTPFILAFSQLMPIFGKVYEDIVQVFQIDGPRGMPYAPYGDFHKYMNEAAEAMHDKHFQSDFMPLTGVEAKLSSSPSPGLQVLDVGCGAGYHVCLFAKYYPNSHITGLDICSDAVEKALQSARAYPNTAFIVSDASDMPKDWTDKFDYVTIFEALHDQARPDLTLAEIHRVLKPGGVFTLLEIKATSNVYQDKQTAAVASAFTYGVSLFHCLQVGSNYEGSLQLGTMYGNKNFLKLLKNAGFDDVQVIETPFFHINVLFLCKKNPL